jgi:hypothetical protein
LVSYITTVKIPEYARANYTTHNTHIPSYNLLITTLNMRLDNYSRYLTVLQFAVTHSFLQAVSRLTDFSYDASVSYLTEHRRQSGVGTIPLQTHIYEPQPRTHYIRI